jgi:hypothetical protein
MTAPATSYTMKRRHSMCATPATMNPTLRTTGMNRPRKTVLPP